MAGIKDSVSRICRPLGVANRREEDAAAITSAVFAPQTGGPPLYQIPGIFDLANPLGEFRPRGYNKKLKPLYGQAETRNENK